MAFKEKSQKQLQVAEQIKRELANIFLHGDIFKSTSLKITVYEADISPDLKNVKVFINVIGEERVQNLLNELNNNSRYFQQRISKSLKLKNIPKVRFIIDNSIDNAGRISRVLDQENEEFNNKT